MQDITFDLDHELDPYDTDGSDLDVQFFATAIFKYCKNAEQRETLEQALATIQLYLIQLEDEKLIRYH